jgi:hypothetical protein
VFTVVVRRLVRRSQPSSSSSRYYVQRSWLNDDDGGVHNPLWENGKRRAYISDVPADGNSVAAADKVACENKPVAIVRCRPKTPVHNAYRARERTHTDTHTHTTNNTRAALAVRYGHARCTILYTACVKRGINEVKFRTVRLVCIRVDWSA